MADKLKELPDIQQVKLVPSMGGAFEIKVDGKLIYSKLQNSRFPDEGEIEDNLSRMTD